MPNNDIPERESFDNETLDFSDEASSEDIQSGEVQLGNEYDSRPKEDEARRVIAYLLIGLLWVLVAGIVILVAFGSISMTDIKEFSVIIGPVVALVSAATGFYYGTKSQQ